MTETDSHSKSSHENNIGGVLNHPRLHGISMDLPLRDPSSYGGPGNPPPLRCTKSFSGSPRWCGVTSISLARNSPWSYMGKFQEFSASPVEKMRKNAFQTFSSFWDLKFSEPELNVCTFNSGLNRLDSCQKGMAPGHSNIKWLVSLTNNLQFSRRPRTIPVLIPSHGYKTPQENIVDTGDETTDWDPSCCVELDWMSGIGLDRKVRVTANTKYFALVQNQW